MQTTLPVLGQEPVIDQVLSQLITELVVQMPQPTYLCHRQAHARHFDELGTYDLDKSVKVSSWC